MNILVTGGAGFLGSHLTRTLIQQGHHVRVLDHNTNSETESIVGDVCDSETVKQALEGIQVVFHLAAHIEAGESVKEPYEYTRNNVLGFVVLLEEMRKADVKTCIFSSSAAVYGEPIRVPIFEDDRTMPINPYGMTKLAMEGLASSYSFAHHMTCIGLRYFNLYGPGEHHEPETHAIPRFIMQIAKNEEVTLWGDGENQRDFIHVADVVSAHTKAMELTDGTYHYFNISGKNATKVIDVISMIEENLTTKANVTHFPARLGDPMLLFADASKAKNELGWEPQVDLKTGLAETIAWFRESGKLG